MNDEAVRTRLVSNIVFSKSQIGLRNGVFMQTMRNSVSGFTDPEAYKTMYKVSSTVAFDKMQGRYEYENTWIEIRVPQSQFSQEQML